MCNTLVGGAIARYTAIAGQATFHVKTVMSAKVAERPGNSVPSPLEEDEGMDEGEEEEEEEEEDEEEEEEEEKEEVTKTAEEEEEADEFPGTTSALVRYPNVQLDKEVAHPSTSTPSPPPYNANFVVSLSSNSPIPPPFDQFDLLSFPVETAGVGSVFGCRHSGGVRIIIPKRKAPTSMQITCRCLRSQALSHPPPLMEGEACASYILEMGPTSSRFFGPIIIEVPHFASLRGGEREIAFLRSDDGTTWREHIVDASDDLVEEVLNESYDGEDLKALEDLTNMRIARILTTDFPRYFALITRVRQEVRSIGPEGGIVSSTVVPQVQAVFSENALNKKIKVGLQVLSVPPELVASVLGDRVAVSPIVTIEPRRRKFHNNKWLTVSIPVPQIPSSGVINRHSVSFPTLRLLCSLTGGTTRAHWEDVTDSTSLTYVNDCVSFTTTVSARFWLIDCRSIKEAVKMANELYREAIQVPFQAKFVMMTSSPMSDDNLSQDANCCSSCNTVKPLERQLEHFVEVRTMPHCAFF